MKTKNCILLLFVFTMIILLSHCSNIEGNYDNPLDPKSGVYSPSSPNLLQITITSDTLVSLVWKNNSIGEEGFIIERKIGITGTYGELTKVLSNITNFEDHIVLHRGTTYYYRVSAFSNKIKSGFTADDSVLFNLVVPVKPTITLQQDNSFRIDWSDNDLVQNGYALEKSLNGDQFYKLATLDKGTNYFIDKDIDTLNRYSYRVKSFTNNNESDYSDVTQIEYSVYDFTLLKTVYLGNPVNSVVFNSDGSMFAAAGMSYALNIWRTRDYSLYRNLSYTGSDVTSFGWPFQVAFSRDGKLVAGNASNSGVNIWNIQTGNLVRKLSVSGDARSICFTNDSQTIITGTFSSAINIWDISNGVLTASLHTPSTVTFLYVTKGGDKLVSGNYGFSDATNAGIQIWNTGNWSEISSYIGFQSENYSVSSDEKYFIEENNLRSLGNGSVVGSFPGTINNKICLTYDNKYFIGKYYSGAFVVGRVNDGKILFSKSVTSPDIYTYPVIASSPSAYIFITTGNTSGAIDVWAFMKKWISY